MKEIIINTKEEYYKVQYNVTISDQNKLLAKGYKWIDGTSVYYDLFKWSNGFYKMRFVIHKKDKTFEWRFLKEEKND